jgi:hypothetical protein
VCENLPKYWTCGNLESSHSPYLNGSGSMRLLRDQDLGQELLLTINQEDRRAGIRLTRRKSATISIPVKNPVLCWFGAWVYEAGGHLGEPVQPRRLVGEDVFK